MFSIPFLDNLWNHHLKPWAPTIAAIVISIELPGASAFWNTLNIQSGFAQVAITGFISGSVATGNIKGVFSAGMFYGAGSANNLIYASADEQTVFMLQAIV